MNKNISNSAYVNMQALRRELRLEDYRQQMDRLESAIKKEKLQIHNEKQHENVVNSKKVDLYI